jgi:hypothetical protein
MWMDWWIEYIDLGLLMGIRTGISCYLLVPRSEFHWKAIFFWDEENKFQSTICLQATAMSWVHRLKYCQNVIQIVLKFMSKLILF